MRNKSFQVQADQNVESSHGTCMLRHSCMNSWHRGFSQELCCGGEQDLQRVLPLPPEPPVPPNTAGSDDSWSTPAQAGAEPTSPSPPVKIASYRSPNAGTSMGWHPGRDTQPPDAGCATKGCLCTRWHHSHFRVALGTKAERTKTCKPPVIN